jgi:8-oxo-dGTP diphosphatase
MSFTYEYPRPAITVDVVLFYKQQTTPLILLIQRKNPPFQGRWAFPGGFMDMNETLIDAAHRELFEETGIQNVSLTQYKTYDAIDRDPRHRTLSTIFFGFVDTDCEPFAGDDAQQAQWFPINASPELAFDHALILSEILAKLTQ